VVDAARAGDLLVVDENAISAAKILDLDSVDGDDKQSVLSTHERVVEGQLAVRAPSDEESAGRQLEVVVQVS
jgi:hypothetical protein